MAKVRRVTGTVTIRTEVDREQLGRALYDLLLAPWRHASPYAITTACALLEHPRRPATLAKPIEEQPCICGHISPPTTPQRGKETA